MNKHGDDKRACDTCPEADAVQVRLLRAATPARRLQIAMRLSDTVRHLSRRAIDHAHPLWSEREKDLLFVAVHYGREWAERLDQYWGPRDAEG